MRDFELGELHLQCKRSPLTKQRRDATSAGNASLSSSVDQDPTSADGAATDDAVPAVEVNADVNKTQ